MPIASLHKRAARPARVATLLAFITWAPTAFGVDFRTTGPGLQVGSDVSGALEEVALRLLGPYSASRGGGPQRLLVALGNAPEALRLIPEEDVRALPSESDAFIIRSSSPRTADAGPVVVACRGLNRRAIGFSFFELLQRLGFAFLHPLKAVLPKALPDRFPDLDVLEVPRWHFRGTHYHTQHPLELTNFLSGYDAQGGCQDRDRWAVAWPAWEAFLVWMLAQRQNYVEWMILADRQVRSERSLRGGDFELSAERQERLRQLVQKAHDLGIEVGADVPLTFRQQHALNLLPRSTGRPEEDAAQVRGRIQWILNCGFDHLGTELGTTEFTRGLKADELIRLLNVTKQALGPHRRLLVKNHCSTKQHAEGFPDPRAHMNGADVNFNYLSYFADPEIVAMPHTVQVYSLQDYAPTYGNRNFGDLRNWTRFLLREGRPVVYYPETSYWVNYDISVPLFLAPLYTKSRVDDALDLDAIGGPRPLLGQLNFESGWQWGYWLANSAQAAVAWRKSRSTSDIFDYIFRFLGRELRNELVPLLNRFAEAQHRLLVNGLHTFKGEREAPPPPGIGAGALTGMAYLQGNEGLSDMGTLLARYIGEGAPQPDRLRFADLWGDPKLMSLRFVKALSGKSDTLGDALLGGARTAYRNRAWYREHLRPLFMEMNSTFTTLSRRFDKLPAAPAAAVELLRDLQMSARLLSLRCGQVLALYDHAADCGGWSNGWAGTWQPTTEQTTSWCDSRLAAARGALQMALALVPEREEHYGLPEFGLSLETVSRWQDPVPTAYSYGYLWGVHRLFYWQRDQAIVEGRIHNPCFATINDPVELGLAGGGSPLLRGVHAALQGLMVNTFWKADLGECLGPKEEPSPLASIWGECQDGCEV